MTRLIFLFLILITVKILSFGTFSSEQKVLTQEQSDQCLHIAIPSASIGHIYNRYFEVSLSDEKH